MDEPSAASSGRLDPLARYRLVGNAMAVLVLLVAAGQVLGNWTDPNRVDFISFWGAARLAIAGNPAQAYDPAVLHHLQSSIVAFGPGEVLPFPYLPVFLLLVIPFGLLSFPVAMMLWVGATLCLYVLAMKRLVPNANALAIAFPPVLINLLIGQNGLLTAAIFSAAMAAVPRRPFVGGLIAGCLLVKPQLGLLLPLAFLASRQWRAFLGAALSSVGLALAGIVAFGMETSIAWARQLPVFGSIAKDGLVGWQQLSSVYSAARLAGAGSGAALMLHVLVAGAAAMAVWHVWRIEKDSLAKASVLACATALASPYLFLYDQVILVIPCFWLAQNKCRPAILISLWFIPLLSMAQRFVDLGPINLGPVLPILLLVLVMKQLSERGPRLWESSADRVSLLTAR